MKKIDAVQKLTDNPHLNLYHIDARDTKGNPFDYFFASRNPQEKLKLSTGTLLWIRERRRGRRQCGK